MNYLKGCFPNKKYIGLFLFLIIASRGYAVDPSKKGEFAKYLADNTFAERQAFARSLGNYRVSPGLVADFKVRLERLRLKSLGFSDREIDGILPEVSWPSRFRTMRSKGNNKVFALIIDFPEYPSTTNLVSLNANIFGDGDGYYSYPFESVRNFYRRSSYNQLEIQGTTLGCYHYARPRSTIKNATDEQNLIKEALNYFDAQGHDFSQYDNDGDGKIEYFIFLWAGPWEVSGTWWSGAAGLAPFGISFVLDGKQFQWSSYCIMPELYADPIVISHETGHALGLPDLYDLNDSVGPHGGVGGMDIMGEQGWMDHNGFSKMLLGWLTPQVVSYGSRTVVLPPAASTPSACIFWPDYSIETPLTEFFLIENRSRINNDFFAPNDGFLIWHIDATLNSAKTDFLYNNTNTDHKLVRLMEADGREDIERQTIHLWEDPEDYFVPGKSFTPTTKPNSNAYNGADTRLYLDSIIASGLNMVCNISCRIVRPPSNLSATLQVNRSVTQSENIVDLKWESDPEDAWPSIGGYNVYRYVPGGWSKVAELGALAHSYRLRKVPKLPQQYGVTTVSSEGEESDLNKITINQPKK
jgi:M6 family metalloprotease-like protein